MSAGNLRLVASSRQRHHRTAEETRAGFEHDNTVAALAFIRPYLVPTFTPSTRSDAASNVLRNIINDFEDEIYAYVTGRPVEDVR